MNVKVQFQGEIRRFELLDQDDLSSLCQRLQTMFSLSSPFVVKYKDEDGDFITLRDTSELEVAKKLTHPLLRLFIEESNPVTAAAVAAVAAVAAAPLPRVTRPVRFTLKNGAVVTLNCNIDMLAKLGLAEMSKEQLEAQFASSWKLRDVVEIGLVAPDEVAAICREHHVRVPKAARCHDAVPLSEGHPHAAHPHAEAPHSHWQGFGRRHHHPYHRFHHHGGDASAERAPGGGEEGGANKHFLRHQHRGRRGHHCHSHHRYAPEDLDAQMNELSVSMEGHECRGRRDSVRFVKHLSVPDGTLVPPGATMTKVWRVRNDSSSPWPAHCEVVHVGGDNFGIVNAVPVAGGVLPNTETQLSVDVTFPARAGCFQGFFRVKDVNGQRFGQRLWISVMVSSASSSSEAEDFVAVQTATARTAVAADSKLL